MFSIQLEHVSRLQCIPAIMIIETTLALTISITIPDYVFKNIFHLSKIDDSLFSYLYIGFVESCNVY